MIYLFIACLVGLGLYYLWLKNRNTKVSYENINTAFILAAAVSLAGSWIGTKAKFVEWLPWLVYPAFAELSAYAAYRFLKVKKDNNLVMSALYGGTSKMAKDERNLWMVVRGVLLLALLAFFLWGFIFPVPCDIDAIYLSCRIKWTIGDIVGIPLFLIGVLTLSGIPKGLGNILSPERSTWHQALLFAELALSIGLIWAL